MDQQPLAYFITFTTYGTWLQGRNPGWVKRGFNEYGSPIQEPNDELEKKQRLTMRQLEYCLDNARREVVLRTILEVSAHRKWQLWAAHVRSNHVHIIISAPAAPEKVMADFKAWSSRRLREHFGEELGRCRWTQHGSTRYLWNEDALAEKVEYVVNGQGEAMAVFDFQTESTEPES